MVDNFEGGLELQIHAAQYSVNNDIAAVELVLKNLKRKLASDGRERLNCLGELQAVGPRLDADIARLCALQDALASYHTSKKESK